MLKTLMAAAAFVILAAPANLPVQAEPPKAAVTSPMLIVAISVDQLSADLFAEYRNRFTGGFARLLDGAVFPIHRTRFGWVECLLFAQSMRIPRSVPSALKIGLNLT